MVNNSCPLDGAKPALAAVIFLSILALDACSPPPPQLQVSQYRFQLSEETYRIRSISSADKTESYNELIGGHFWAADYDQDRVLDAILLGEVRLEEAQKIYEYGLDKLTQENKLRVRSPSITRYLHEDNGIQIEIRSFRPMDAQPFNEFILLDKRQQPSPRMIILVDKDGDGILDEVLKGEITMDAAQAQYAEAIRTGLQKNELIKLDGAILVKEK